MAALGLTVLRLLHLLSLLLVHHLLVLGLLLAGGLLIKLRLERAWAVPIGFDSGWAFNVIYAAHLTGAVAGAALALLLEACHRLFGRRPPRAAVD